jgi:hypothetical protein
MLKHYIFAGQTGRKQPTLKFPRHYALVFLMVAEKVKRWEVK